MAKFSEEHSYFICMGLLLMVERQPDEYMVAAHNIALKLARDFEMEEAYLAIAGGFESHLGIRDKGWEQWIGAKSRAISEYSPPVRPKSKRSWKRSGTIT